MTKKISQLKENESSARQTCQCIGWGGINKRKHSWNKSPSTEFHNKFQKLTNCSFSDEQQTCNICEVNFTNMSHMDKHKQTHENIVTDLPEAETTVHECESCTDKFTNARDFIHHMESNHKKAAVVFLD